MFKSDYGVSPLFSPGPLHQLHQSSESLMFKHEAQFSHFHASFAKDDKHVWSNMKNYFVL